MSSATAEFDAALMDIAAHWCAESLRLGAQYAQVFVEASSDLRLEARLRDGTATTSAASVSRRHGVGLLFRHEGTWKYGFAPLHEPQTLAARLRALGLGAARIPRDRPGPQPGEAEPVRAADPFDEVATDLPKGGSVHFIQDFYRQHRLVVDSDGVRSAQFVGGGRQRASATVLGEQRLSRAFTRASDPRWRMSGDWAELAESAVGLVRSALTQAEELTGARSLGARSSPVVLGPKAGAALLHELVGHALEADNFAKNPNAATLNGSRITRTPLNLLDDPSIPTGIGSRRTDDDGRECRPVPLVDGGVVVGALTSMRTAPASTGSANGRRESYRHACLPRASNTSVLAGTDSVASLLEPSPEGVLHISSLGSGEFSSATGEFSFTAAAAHFITPLGERIPLRDVDLYGDSRQTVERLAGIADDVRGDSATCGKQGQSILIGLYSPTLRFDRLDWRC